MAVTHAPTMLEMHAVEPPSRGVLLPALYASYGALQAFDAYSTTSGIRRGAIETNPLMAGVAGKSAAVWSLKAGIAVATVSAAEQLWRQHRRTQAILVMVAANGAMAAVAANNASVLRRMK